MKQPNYICSDCAKGLEPVTEMETVNKGLCDVCNKDGIWVAPARWYGYPVVCGEDGLVLPVHKPDGTICPVCRIVLK